MFKKDKLTCVQPDLPAACNAETQPGQWHRDHEWPPSQHTATGQTDGLGEVAKLETTCNHQKSFSQGIISLTYSFSDKCLDVFN